MLTLKLNSLCYIQENIHQETRVSCVEKNRDKNSGIGKIKINLELLILLYFSLVFHGRLLLKSLDIGTRINKYYT